MSAYPNYELQPYTDDPSSLNEWTLNGGATDNTDALTDGTDTKYISTSVANDEITLDFNSNWSRDPRPYELIVMKIRAKYTGTGTCQIRMRVTNTLDAFTEDLTTSWVDYWIATCARTDLATGIQLEGTLDYLSNTAYHCRVVASISSGTPTVEVSEIRFYTIPIADHAIIYPDSDGSNEGWSLQTGTDSYAMVDNSQSLTDWTGTGLADDSTDYLHSDADDERTDLGLTTPTYSIGAGDFVVVWFCANNAAGTLNMINPIQVDLIESGTSFTTQMWGISAQVGNRSNTDAYQIDDSARIPRFSPVVLQLDTAPSNWANVQIKLVSDTITAGVREPSIFSLAVISGFGYSPPYTFVIAEGTTLSEDVFKFREVLIEIVEGTSGNDSLSNWTEAIKQIAEDATFNETAVALINTILQIAEDTSLNEALLIWNELTLLLTDDTTLSEALAIWNEAVKDITEATTLDELLALWTELTKDITDDATLSAAALVFGEAQLLIAEDKTLSEAVFIIQELAAIASENMTLTEAVQYLGTWHEVIADDASFSETIVLLAEAVLSASDQATLNESASLLGIFTELVAEGMTYSEAVTTWALIVAIVIEGTSLTEEVLYEVYLNFQIAEDANLSEAVSAIIEFVRSVSEEVSLDESLVLLSEKIISVTEGMSLSEIVRLVVNQFLTFVRLMVKIVPEVTLKTDIIPETGMETKILPESNIET